MAGRSEEALTYIAKLAGKGVPIDDAIMRTYEHLANEFIGGKLVRYTVSPGAVERLVRPIRDTKPLRMWPVKGASLHADMQGNVIARKITLTGTVENSTINTSTINAGTINGGTINGAQIIGGSIRSNTDIDITRDIRVGNNIYLGLTGQITDRRIAFVDPSIYEAYLSFTGSSRELKLRGANDVRIDAGLNAVIKAGFDVILQPSFGAYVGNTSAGNRIVVASELSTKANVSEAAYNMTYDSSTKNLKLWTREGSLLAQVTLS
ncbi:hypothetical protein U9M73_13170 [Paenibacillus phoenicis]|uniref:Adhesin domain-containing protein n=1 Tax=Paenibacillus phoenicis TaxID=554117 RepID=A0ABU5PM27_9BACL|nr:hypothetical protein [Paenibacillus phoenicis]MEA3570936.1 hypothetical protein [Paenibacillus phoenicis]